MTAPRDANERWRRAVESLAPSLVVVPALAISHPDAPATIRIIRDTSERVIEGERYAPVRFDGRLVTDIEGEPPHAEIRIVNVGWEITRWIETSGGGYGAAVRVMEASIAADGSAVVEWELHLRALSITADQAEVRARVGYTRLDWLPAVVARHDQRRSPGLI